MTIHQLQPAAVWKYFYDITRIPHPSKKEEKLIRYLLDFAAEHQLESHKDAAGNVLIKKPASRSGLAPVILQSHIDMVCEKNVDVDHNFDTDPIETIVEGNWLKAKGTTLGADNGIGVAAQLAILAASNIEHGDLECLFTVDEETGLTGAHRLSKNFLTARYLINLDTEEEGEFYIGCAGGKGTIATFNYIKEKTPAGYFWFRIDVKGLMGGHSGSEINTGRGNANKILNRYLWKLSKKYDFVLAEIGGGNQHNAIPRESYAVCGVPYSKKESVAVELNLFIPEIEEELKITDPNVKIYIESITAPLSVIDKQTTNNLLNAIYACPHGVLGMSYDLEGLVETSTNLASVKMDGNKIITGTSQRSFSESLKENAANMVNAVFTLAGAEVIHNDGYPGWKPNPDSEIVKIGKRCYLNLFGKEPEVKAIHAGLECGLFLEKYPYLDMISCGPTIREAHSPDEKVEISTVEKWWKLLLEMLKNIPETK